MTTITFTKMYDRKLDNDNKHQHTYIISKLHTLLVGV